MSATHNDGEAADRSTAQVERSHGVHANAWCDVGCGWTDEGNGRTGVARVRRAAAKHAATEWHQVALDVTSIDRYSPVRPDA